MTEPRPNPRRSLHSQSEGGLRPVPYEAAESALVAPRLRGEVSVAATVDEVIDRLAADLVLHAEACVRQFGDFHLALSGGKTPQPLYERLMYDPNCRRLPWIRTHLWLVDERCVPFDHPLSNFRMINEIIVDHSDIPRTQVHPIPALSPTADAEYEAEIRETLAWREKGQDRLDAVVLGVGEDGHTASLFPHTEPLHEAVRLVRFNDCLTAHPVERITMTFPLINSARFIAVLVTGASKAAILKRVAASDESAESLPILHVAPMQGQLKWYLDGPACGYPVID